MKAIKGSIGFGLVLLLAVPTFAGPGSNDKGQAVNRVHSVGGRSYYVVQMAPKVTAASRGRLEATGIRILRYLPQDSFIVSSSPEVKAKAKMKSLPGVLGVRDLQPAEKLSPRLDVKYDAELNSRIEEDRRSGHKWAGTMVPVDTRAWIDVRIAPMEASAAVDVARAVESRRGSTVNVSSIGLGSVTARIRRESLVELAATPAVLWIERDEPMQLQNDIARWTIQSKIESVDENYAAPIHAHGIHGEGQIVTIADTGIEITHPMFDHHFPPGCTCGAPGCTCVLPGDPHRKIRAYYSLQGVPSEDLHDTGCLNHGTFVAGVVAGDAWPYGTYEPTLAVTLAGGTGVDGPHDGQAFGARIEVQGDRPADGNLEGLFTPLIDPSRYPPGTPVKNFSWIHTNSWAGEAGAARYDPHSAQIDNFVYAHPDMTVIFAVGNHGGTTTTPATHSAASESVAKNVIAVGATENGVSVNEPDADDLWVSTTIVGFSSSRGPSADGRIKPDVLAPTGVWSAEGCQGNRNEERCVGTPEEPTGVPVCLGGKYVKEWGTSFSAPAVAAAAALVRQYFMEGWYPGGALGSGPELVPSAALIKATLINSAQEIAGANAYAQGNVYPNNDQGWGRILLDAVLHFQGDTSHLVVHDERTGLDQDEFTTYSFYNSSEFIPFKATLVWSDPPGTPDPLGSPDPPSPQLVNDLDLVVTTPNQQTVYLGNRFTGYNRGHSQENLPSDLPAPDTLNNVEEVLVLDPQKGIWTISVKARHVPMGPQSYALVLTGANDQDGDGKPGASDPDDDGDGDADVSDCGPMNPAIFHGAIEVCNGIDDDCSGVIDDGTEAIPFFGGAAVTCQDGFDNDCDGVVDLDCAVDVDATGQAVGPEGFIFSGALSDLQATSSQSPTSYEVINETGTSTKRQLTAVWTFTTTNPSGYNYDLAVEAFHNTGSNDDFEVRYFKKASGQCLSTDSGWSSSTLVFNVIPTSDNNTVQRAFIGPLSPSVICVRVKDSRTTSDSQVDALTMDRVYLVPSALCPDADGDGYASTCSNCNNFYCPTPDCDDTDAQLNPGGTEGPLGHPTCSDLKDNDCDGLVDMAEAQSCVPPPPAVVASADAGLGPGEFVTPNWELTKETDDSWEVVRETLQNNKWKLEMTWRFDNVPNGSNHKLRLEAHRDNQANDDFQFYYSTDGTHYFAIPGALVNHPFENEGGQLYPFGAAGLSGTFYIKAKDTSNDTATPNDNDSLFVDFMVIVTDP